MSTLTVTAVTTGNATTDHTISTGNTAAGDMVIYSNGYGIALGGNSSTNTATLSPNGHIVFANSTANTWTLTSAGNIGIGSSTPASKFYVKKGTISFEPSNPEYYAASFYAAQNATTNYGLQVRTNWQAVENKIVSFGVVDAVSGTDTERFVINGVGAVTISSNTLTLGTSTLAANGYTTLPNGMKMNWGVIICNTVSNAVFTSAFTTNAISISVTPITASIYITANTVYVPVINNTAAQIRSLSTTTTASVYFMAIGY